MHFYEKLTTFSRQYLKLGMKLIKVHRVISFDQSPWIKPYIELNTQLRQKAACKAEEELPKLMNNSFFGECIIGVWLLSNLLCAGKTCEDVYKYRDVKLVFGEEQTARMLRLQSSPLFESVTPFSEFSCAVQMRKAKVVLDKPRYVGCCILAISKEIMYSFHYDFMLPNFPGTLLTFLPT